MSFESALMALNDPVLPLTKELAIFYEAYDGREVELRPGWHHRTYYRHYSYLKIGVKYCVDHVYFNC